MTLNTALQTHLKNKLSKHKDGNCVGKNPADDHLASQDLIKCAQIDGFSDFIANPKTYSGKLCQFSPFIDSEGVLRVGGCLSKSNLEYPNKYPILIPKDHPLTNLLIDHYHVKTKHQGRYITLSVIRQAGCFVLNGSNVIKKFTRSCVVCKKLRLALDNQGMAD